MKTNEVVSLAVGVGVSLILVLLPLSLAVPPLPIEQPWAVSGAAGPIGPAQPSLTVPRLDQAYGKLPLYFIENHGQVDGRVAYYLQGRYTTVYFAAEGVTIALTGPVAPPPAEEPRAIVRPVSFRTLADSAGVPQRWAVKLDFVGANPDVRPRGEDPTPAVISYFKGPREQWKSGLRTYASLVYPNLWPGIDLAYSGAANQLKYAFVVKPGADPAQIRLAYRGATAVTLNEAGQLQVSTPAGGFHDDRPYAYQEDEQGRRVEVTAAYALEGGGQAEMYSYGFRVGAYDTSKPLVLDPAMFVYAGYIGGTLRDRGEGIAVDSVGNAYITGLTGSTNFPAAVGPDLSYNGNDDAFVAKVTADGTGLVYAGYIGGTGSDQGLGIAVDSAGNAYVTGQTNSSDFPVTVGPDLTYNNGGQDAFVAKVNATGTALDYAGYIGGTSGDGARAIAVDSAGNAYVTGSTQSADFPVIGGLDSIHNGGEDAFVAKVNAAGTALDYAGYIGGISTDLGLGIAVDTAGYAYVTGVTQSTQVTFPVAVGPDLIHNGVHDAFVAKVEADGTALVYAGYIGGADVDAGFGIAVDSTGYAYVAGSTLSTEATFPDTVGPDLTYNGGGDAFVAKVRADGTGLVYAGYIGGADEEVSGDKVGIAVDSAGYAYIGGETSSSEATFPVTEGPDSTFNGGNGDAFVAKVKADGAGLVFAGYIGGDNFDRGWGIAVDSVGSAYVTGATGSSEATFPATVGPDLTFNGGNGDVFVAKIANTPSGTSVSVLAGNGVTLTFTNVVSSGETSATTSSTGPLPPHGFTFGSPVTFFDVTTTATYDPPVSVCITYNPAQFGDPSTLRLFHFENGAWVDVTTSNDTINGTICGQVSSLSPFVIAQAFKDACKKGGWRALTRADLTRFKNQGDCIQYANTGK